MPTKRATLGTVRSRTVPWCSRARWRCRRCTRTAVVVPGGCARGLGCRPCACGVLPACFFLCALQLVPQRPMRFAVGLGVCPQLEPSKRSCPRITRAALTSALLRCPHPVHRKRLSLRLFGSTCPHSAQVSLESMAGSLSARLPRASKAAAAASCVTPRQALRSADAPLWTHRPAQRGEGRRRASANPRIPPHRAAHAPTFVSPVFALAPGLGLRPRSDHSVQVCAVAPQTRVPVSGAVTIAPAVLSGCAVPHPWMVIAANASGPSDFFVVRSVFTTEAAPSAGWRVSVRRSRCRLACLRVRSGRRPTPATVRRSARCGSRLRRA